MVRSLFIFLAGIAFWDAFVHFDLQMLGMIPMNMRGVLITKEVNAMIIGSLLIACVALLFIARKMRCDC